MKTERKEIVYIPTKLPEKWIDETARSYYRNEIAVIEGWLNNQFKEAIESEDINFDISLIKKLIKSETAIYDMMRAKYNEYVKQISYMPKVEKERVENSFFNVADRLKSICTDVHYKLKPYNYTLKQAKDGSICFDPNEINEYVETIGIRIFSEKEQQYTALLDAATKALVDCANFEREHGINDYALQCFGMIPSMDGLTSVAYPCGLANDAKTGTVNAERIIKGMLNI